MDMKRLKIHLENVRAIDIADIELSDITVLAGVNASGKSTIARYFHAVVEASRKHQEYTAFVALFAGSLAKCLAEVMRVLTVFPRNKICEKAISNFVNVFRKPAGLKPEDVPDLLTTVKSALADETLRKKIDADARVLDGLNRALHLSLSDSAGLLDYWDKEMSSYKSELKKCVNPGYKFPFYPLALNALTGGDVTAMAKMSEGRVIVSDGDVRIYDSHHMVAKKTLIYSPQRSVYLDNPSVTIPTREGDWIKIGENVYPYVPQNDLIASVSSVKVWRTMLEEAWAGHLDEPKGGGNDGWVFVQKGVDRPIPFFECAEGIKSLSGMDLLDRFNLLDSGTLLVVDEPEVHLHPQWIVTYAKILISLVKNQHIRVLVTTHSPYLVRALRNLSIGELDSNQLSYYVAERNEATGKFKYRSLGTDIAPIFKIFNVALESIAYIQE